MKGEYARRADPPIRACALGDERGAFGLVRRTSAIGCILGALLSGFLRRMVGFHGAETQLAGHIFSVAGAILLVVENRSLRTSC